MEDWELEVKNHWNQVSDSEWYQSLRTEERLDRLRKDPKTAFYPGMILYDDKEVDYVVGAGAPEATVDVGVAPPGVNTLVALRRTEGGAAEAVLLNPNGGIAASATLAANFTMDLAGGAIALGGDGYAGEIGEFRIWESAARANADLHAKREFVSPFADGLALYFRPITDDPNVAATAAAARAANGSARARAG